MWKKFLIPYYINSFWAEPWLGGPVASQNLFFMGGRLPRNFFFLVKFLKSGYVYFQQYFEGYASMGNLTHEFTNV